MIRCPKTDEQTRGFNDVSSQRELITNCIGRKILIKHGYNPVKPLHYETSIFSGGLESLNDGTDYGVDDMFFTDEIPDNDPLHFKEVKPFNGDNIFYSIDYKSNNFRNFDRNNDKFIYIKLFKFLGYYKYQKGILWKNIERGNGEIYKINGILSKEKQTDLLFYIKSTRANSMGEIPPHSLINAYLIPAQPLKNQVIDNLNQIRAEHNKQPLNLSMGTIDLLFGIYKTWNLYRKTHDLITPNFELLRQPDLNPRNNADLMMKVRYDTLPVYITFNENGNIVEYNP